MDGGSIDLPNNICKATHVSINRDSETWQKLHIKSYFESDVLLHSNASMNSNYLIV